MNRRTWPQRFLLGFNLVFIVSALALAWLLNLTWEKAASVNRVELSGSLTPANPTTPGERVINILLGIVHVGRSVVHVRPTAPITQNGHRTM